jgi:hypothetical protein
MIRASPCSIQAYHWLFACQGVCKLGGLTIFCSRALPGEVLRARILTIKKSHALVRSSMQWPGT